MSDVELVPLQRLSGADLDVLAAAHRRALDGLLTDLGFELVRRFYASAARSSHLFGAAARLEGRAVGAVVGTGQPDEAFTAVASPAWRFGLHVLRHRPQVLPQLAVSWLRPAHAEATPDKSAELLYIFTDQAARGHGIGRRLVSWFMHEAKDRNFDYVTLSVEEDNAGAIGLYEKLGFETWASGRREGRFVRQRMGADLRGGSP